MPATAAGMTTSPAARTEPVQKESGASVGKFRIGRKQKQKRPTGTGSTSKCWLCVEFGGSQSDENRLRMHWNPLLGEMDWADGHTQHCARRCLAALPRSRLPPPRRPGRWPERNGRHAIDLPSAERRNLRQPERKRCPLPLNNRRATKQQPSDKTRSGGLHGRSHRGGTTRPGMTRIVNREHLPRRCTPREQVRSTQHETRASTQYAVRSTQHQSATPRNSTQWN